MASDRWPQTRLRTHRLVQGPVGTSGRRDRAALGGCPVRPADDSRVMLCDNAPMATVRTFNTEGPVVAADHYHIPPLERIDLDAVLGMIRDKKYFVLHAPRQTGKTSALLVLRDLLNGGAQGRLPLRVRQRRGGPGDARERGGRHAHGAVPVCAQGEPDARRRLPGAYLSRGHEQRRTRWRAEPDAESLGRCRPHAAGAADRRDRRAGRRYVAGGPAPVAQRGTYQRPEGFSAERRPVRRAGRARLPHPVVSGKPPGARRQRVQHQVGVVAARATSPSRRSAP